jgi:hypothetical protein
VFLSDGSSKTQQKTFCKKPRRKVFTKKSTKKSKIDFILGFVLSRFWAFLGEGSIKTQYKNIPKKSDPGTVLASDLPTYPPTPLAPRFFGAAPCAYAYAYSA